MAFQQLKEKTQLLRKEGKSINEISKLLNASKSTVSHWCRNISLSKPQIQMLVERQKSAGAIGRLRAAEIKRTKRIANTLAYMERGARDVGTLTQRDMLILGLSLYWGEGYKNGNDECGLTNSDPGIILAFIKWLKQVYGIQNQDLILRVSLNGTHRNRTSRVEKHWSKITGIPLSQFTKTSLIKMQSIKIYTNRENHFGTLRVKVRKATTLRRRIMGSLSEIHRQIAQ